MIEEDFRFRATLDYVMAAFERYTHRHRPPGVRKVFFIRGPITSGFSPDILEQTATIYDASIPGNHVPIVELRLAEDNRTCRVRIRCYESRYAHWYGGLIGRPQEVSSSKESAPTSESTKSTWRLGKLLAFLRLVRTSPQAEEIENARNCQPTENVAPPPPSAPCVPIDPDRSGPKPQPPELPAASQAATAPSPAPSVPKRRRGPKPGVSPDEMEALCVLWLEKEQYSKLKCFFCDEHRITEYQLDKALSEREKRLKGPQSG